MMQSRYMWCISLVFTYLRACLLVEFSMHYVYSLASIMTVTELSGKPVTGATIPKPTYMLKPMTSKASGTIALNPADEVVPGCYIRHLYFYRNKEQSDAFMPTKKLVAALHQALELHPLVYGRIHRRADRRLEVRHGADDGIPVYVAQASYGYEVFEPDWAHSRTPAGLEPIAEVVPDETLPTFLVKITRLARNQGVIIGVAGYHAMMDGNSVEILMQAWAAISRGVPPEPSYLDRGLVRVTGPPQFEHPEFRWFHQELEPPSNFGPLVLFHINEEKLSALKNEASLPLSGERLSGTATGDEVYAQLNRQVPWISTNDALCALIWRAVTRARQLSHDKMTNLSIPINARSRFNPPLPRNYFGNGSLGYEANDHVHRLINSPLSYAARLLRKQQQDTANAAFLQSAINFLGTLPESDRIQHPYAVLTGVDFLITNLRSFDFYDIDFGDGPAIQFRLPYDLLSAAAYIVNMPETNPSKSSSHHHHHHHHGDSDGDGGIQVFIGLDTESMSRLRNDEEFCQYATFIG
ncbi:transferase [Syncephalis plumigaleata]|nr:transferase [Syncephalis plumigaleata]